jgi:putative ABC transport system ATP-binding protein
MTPGGVAKDDSWIRCQGLCRYYKLAGHEVRAVDEVTMAVGRGDFVAVTGASGSGKSTLINLLAGLDVPTSGHVEVGGRRLDKMSARELAEYRALSVGFVFQSFNLLPHHTALRNVEMALYFTETPRRNRRSLAESALKRLGLADRLGHRPADLSGGEQQRVAIARAIVKRPEVLFADEPTGNLDRENSDAIVEILNELNREGITVVMVTHDPELAGRAARRSLRMLYGRIEEKDAPAGGAR